MGGDLEAPAPSLQPAVLRLQLGAVGAQADVLGLESERPSTTRQIRYRKSQESQWSTSVSGTGRASWSGRAAALRVWSARQDANDYRELSERGINPI